MSLSVPTAWSRRLAAASGPAFVVLVLAGNSLTESVPAPPADLPPGQAALEGLAAGAGDATVQLGLVAEVLAFCSFLVFAAYLADLLRRRGGLRLAGTVAVIAAVLMVAVKLGSATPYLAGLAHHDELSADAALTLVATNGAAFVLCWLPFSLFVWAAAVALRGAGLLGPVGYWAGVLLGVLGVAAMLAGLSDVNTANPVPFLLGLLWVLVTGVRLVLAEPRTTVGIGETGADLDALMK
ncbi:MAG TPA: hypothetical protein VJ819_01870 [Nocardioidaceae bacterium]|nr:hypothetical protein [Nocardioidaceae bacterium]